MKLNETTRCPRHSLTRFSVVVIGGGPAGAMCARQLSRYGIDVAIIDRSDFKRRRIGETCGPSVERFLLHQCNLCIPPGIGYPLPEFCCAWGSDSCIRTDFRFWQAGRGVVLKRPAFDKWLLDEAESNGAVLRLGAKIQSCERQKRGWLIRVLNGSGPKLIQADFVVEATGRIALPIFQPDAIRFFVDKLMALWRDLPLQNNDNGSAMVESCETGWWYSTRVSSDRRLFVYFTDADMLAERAIDSCFNMSLKSTRHMRLLSGDTNEKSGVRVLTARSSARRLILRDRWLAIGDACYTLDPLSGSGVLRALTSGADAALALSSFISTANSKALLNFATNQGRAFCAALVEKAWNYNLERRWPQSMFWKRRYGTFH